MNGDPERKLKAEMQTKVLQGFLFAPLPFALLLLCGSLYLGAAGIILAAFTLFFGYALVLFLGIPLYFLMKKVDATGPRSYGLAAIFFALLLIGYFIVMPVHAESGGQLHQLFLPARMMQAAFFLFGSFLTVFAFWLFVRPDKHERNRSNL
ncbi:MAG TPA: hypothetical protein DIU09_06495 [Hyphomonadaceae bacterium]|nr:hypothetical protein [Hyphomonadaceae bacterium]